MASILIRRLDPGDPSITPFGVKFVHNMDKIPHPNPVPLSPPTPPENQSKGLITTEQKTG